MLTRVEVILWPIAILVPVLVRLNSDLVLVLGARYVRQELGGGLRTVAEVALEQKRIKRCYQAEEQLLTVCIGSWRAAPCWKHLELNFLPCSARISVVLKYMLQSWQE